MALVEIQDAMNCTIDGVPAGQPIDCIANHPRIASDIQRALIEWQAKKAADLAAKEKEIRRQAQAEVEELRKEADAARAERDALGTTEQARAILKEQKRQRLLAELAELEG